MIHQHRQVIQFVMGGAHGGLPDNSFLALSVPGNGKYPAGIVLSFERQGHAAGDGHSLPQGAGTCFNTGGFVFIGVALQMGIRLTYAPEILPGEVAQIGQYGIDRGPVK